MINFYGNSMGPKAHSEIFSHRVSIWCSHRKLWDQSKTFVEIWINSHWLGWRGLHQISKNQAYKISVLNCLKRIFFIGEQSMFYIYKRCKRWFEILWSTTTINLDTTDWSSCQCLHKIIEFNQSANKLTLFPWFSFSITS